MVNMKPVTCLHCSNAATLRGLCRSCYFKSFNLVRQSRNRAKAWAALVERGMALPRQQRGPKASAVTLKIQEALSK